MRRGRRGIVQARRKEPENVGGRDCREELEKLPKVTKGWLPVVGGARRKRGTDAWLTAGSPY